MVTNVVAPRRLMTLLGVVLLGVLVLAACASPSRTPEDYASKASNTAEAMTSAVQTAILAANAARQGRLPGPATSTTLDEAEADATSIRATFDSIQPPPGVDAQRRKLDPVLDDAVDAIAAVRIAARRGELGRLADLAAPLSDVTRRLAALRGGG